MIIICCKNLIELINNNIPMSTMLFNLVLVNNQYTLVIVSIRF